MMKKSVVFLFSGQGSQYYQMGKMLYEHQPVFRDCMERLDVMAASLTGQSVLSTIYASDKHPADTFDSIMLTHPAIFMVEYALSRLLMEKGVIPDYLLGTSLGEFTAAVVAGVLSEKEAIACLIKQAQLFENSLKPGGMIAVLADYRIFSETAVLYENSTLAGINFESHFVISGNQQNLKMIENHLNAKNIIFQRLPVPFGFHSAAIDFIEAPFKQIHARVPFAAPNIPLLSCALGTTVNRIDPIYLWKVVRQPIQFKDIIGSLGFRDDAIFIDLGPSGTLATFLKYILKPDVQSAVFPVLTPYGNDAENLSKIDTIKPFLKKATHNKEKTMRAVVFPGQGSQRKGMGGSLFDEYAELTSKADQVLGYSIKELCLNDPQDCLGQTQYTQPALYVVNALSYLKQVDETGLSPDFVAGHSLGEYNALFAAGVFDFETGLKLVQKRGELMSKAKGGGMAAVVGLSEEDIVSVVKVNNLTDITAANLNTPSQVVIAGPKDSVAKTESLFISKGAMLFKLLNVSGAFHTPYMASAEKEFSDYIETFTFAVPKIPVVSNVYARPYNPQQIKTTLAKQITSPVRWTDSIRYLMGKNVTDFIEIGTGNILAGMIRKIQAEATPLVVEEEAMEPISPASDELKVEIPPTQQSMPVQKCTERQAMITAESLGSREFKKAYNLKYAYVTGGMYAEIASREMVAKIGKAGMLGFYGTGGVDIAKVEETIVFLKRELDGCAFGINLLGNPMEDALVDLFLKHGIKNIEAAAYIQISPALVRYRLQGLKKGTSGEILTEHLIMAKLSRPEVAVNFLSPAPDSIVQKLLEKNDITKEQAELSQQVPMADHICAEADSGGHTDQQAAYALLPAMMKLRDEMMAKYRYAKPICVGAAGGIGTPEAAAAAFILGADFVLTGSINQCTAEAGASEAVKDLLQQINVQDTDYAPAGDMFELGSKVQVLRKGVFFPARANKLYALYRQYNSLDEIDANTQKQLQERYFKCTFEDIYKDVKAYYPKEELEKAEMNPKHKMALIFRWYFGLSSRLALSGDRSRQVDFQVHCGPALGAFNQWVKGTELEPWQNRHVDQIAIKLMEETAELLMKRFNELTGN